MTDHFNNDEQHHVNTQVLVTGGGGFLGQALCRALVERGYHVTSFNRGQSPHLTALGVRQIQGDLADQPALMVAARGSQAIFHTAAKAGAWGRYADYYRTNVTGTENILAVCRTLGIARLIHTSTPSVTHHAAHPVEGGTADSVPYADHLKAAYAKTKQIAEKMVLAANSPTLATVALRPRLIWGPGDPHLMPRLVARARQGRLRLIGNGQNHIDTTYIDNAVQAHLDAFMHLAPGATCAGRAYFISNAEPWPIANIINALLNTAGVAPITASLPFWMAYAIGAMCEGGWSVLRLDSEPPMTRFLAEQLSTTHWYSMEPARRDFGYQPKVSIEEGLRRLRADKRSTPIYSAS